MNGGISLAVKVQPKSRRPGLQGLAPDIDGARLKLGVTEAPEDGRANRAVCVLLADALGVPQAAVTVTQGATSRQKTLRIDGDPLSLTRKLELLCKPD